MNIRINGWQRLWIVLTIIYITIAFFFTIYFKPTIETINAKRVNASIDILGRYLESNNPGYIYPGSYHIKDTKYKDMTDDQIISHIHSKFNNKIDLSSVENTYQTDLLKFKTERLRYFWTAIIWHTLPPLMIYLLGLSIAWIIRGFRGTNTNYKN